MQMWDMTELMLQITDVGILKYTPKFFDTSPFKK